MLIDTHCHLDAARFQQDRAETIERARRAGVQRMITIGCDVDNSYSAQAIAQKHDDIYFSAGVHPHNAAKPLGEHRPDGTDHRGWLAEIQQLALDEKCVAIGECGLDYYYDHSPRDVQKEVFLAQLQLAKHLDKPVVVHIRDAWDDAIHILKQEQNGFLRGVIHCFTGTQAQAEASLDLGFYLSIPGVVTFKNAGDLPQVVKSCPLDRLLVETDAPYLSPIPHRGKRNEPAFVKYTAQFCADLRALPLDQFIAVTGDNAQRLFGRLA